VTSEHMPRQQVRTLLHEWSRWVTWPEPIGPALPAVAGAGLSRTRQNALGRAQHTQVVWQVAPRLAQRCTARSGGSDLVLLAGRRLTRRACAILAGPCGRRGPWTNSCTD